MSGGRQRRLPWETLLDRCTKCAEGNRAADDDDDDDDDDDGPANSGPNSQAASTETASVRG